MSLFPIRRSHQPRTPITTLWNPFPDWPAFHDRINQLFGTMDIGELLSPDNVWSPSLDISETDREMIVKVDVPGMEKKDVSVEIDQGDLLIKGERKIEKDESKDKYVHVERSYGTFLRRLPLPDYVDQDNITATCRNGLLELRLQLIPGAKKDVRTVNID